MHYLIDGHNLIGKMSDIDLSDPDDEIKLVQRMRSWSASGRKRKVTIYFDHGLPGGVDKNLSSGPVKVIFAHSGQTADALLINRISSTNNPPEYMLVSSDSKIINAAQRRRMKVQRSEEFARRLDQEQEEKMQLSAAAAEDEVLVEKDEVEMWLKLFAQREDENSEQ